MQNPTADQGRLEVGSAARFPTARNGIGVEVGKCAHTLITAAGHVLGNLTPSDATGV